MSGSSSSIKSQILPLAIILAVTTLVIGGYACWSMTDTLTKAATDKAQTLTCILGTALSDPFSMGEYDRMQHILDAVKNADGDLAYAIVVTSDGKAVATTDPTLKDLSLNRNEFEKDALKATDYLVRDSLTPNVFESSIPIKSVGGNSGILRIGTSTEHVQEIVKQIATVMVVICVFSMIVAVIILTGMCKPAATAEKS